MDFAASVLYAAAQVPRGKVTTYKMIAEALGKADSCRAVGSALNKNPDPHLMPCYRVIRSDGRVGGYALGESEKIRLLAVDGIAVEGGRVAGYRSILFRPAPVKVP